MPDKDKKWHEVPFNTRDDLIKQVTACKTRFDNYNRFATANVYGVFAKSYIKHGLILKGNNMNFSYIENVGEGILRLLPYQFKFRQSPFLECSVEDFIDDGNLDF